MTTPKGFIVIVVGLQSEKMVHSNFFAPVPKYNKIIFRNFTESVY
jgi:hypothetical protein